MEIVPGNHDVRTLEAGHESGIVHCTAPAVQNLRIRAGRQPVKLFVGKGREGAGFYTDDVLLHRVFLFPVMKGCCKKKFFPCLWSRGAGEAPGGHRGGRPPGWGMGEHRFGLEMLLDATLPTGVNSVRGAFPVPTSERAPSAQPPHQSKVLGRVGGSGGGITLLQKGFPSPGLSITQACSTAAGRDPRRCSGKPCGDPPGRDRGRPRRRWSRG